MSTDKKRDIKEKIATMNPLAYLEKGFSVIPIRANGKEPLIAWKTYQERLPTEAEVKGWFSKWPDANIGIVTGAVSGNLIVIDFDSEEAFHEFLNQLKDYPDLAMATGQTWIVKTGKGYHVYYRVEMDREEFVKKARTQVRLKPGVDIKAEGGYVVAPPSRHPSGRTYEFVKGGPRDLENPDPIILTPNEFDIIIKLLTPPREEQDRGRRLSFRRLKDAELLKLKELLSPVWVEGQRQYAALYMSGWMAKARIHPVDVARLFRSVAEEKNDPELEQRLSTIYYSYRKLYGGIDELAELDAVIEEWRSRGVLRRSVSKAITKSLEEKVKGKSGIQELLENVLGEEKALDVVREIEETLGTASPFRDSIIEIIDYEKQLYAVCNLRRLIVIRARRKDGRLIYKERVTIGAPTKVSVYVNPLGGLTKYELIWEIPTRPRPITIGPAPIEDIIRRLEAEGLVVNHRLVRDVMNAIIEGFIRKKRAEIHEEIEAPGFYLVNGEVVAVRVEHETPSIEELKEALELLDTLAEKWFIHALDRFATAIKWGLVAPFSYILKQKGRWMKHLFLYGASYTGKTTLGNIILNIWGLDSRYRKTGANIDTPARLGYVLSQSTFPVLINEPGTAIYREDIIEILKNAIESTIARGRYVRGTYVDIPSLAPLIFTSNKVLPKDDALQRRLLTMIFTFGERVDREKAREFEATIAPKLKKLKALGDWIIDTVMLDPSLLDKDWIELAEFLLENAYKTAGLNPPPWIWARYEEKEDIYDDIREAVRNHLVERINNEFMRFVGRVVVESENGSRVDFMNRTDVDLPGRAKIVLDKSLIPWAFLSEDIVILTTGFVNEIRKVIGDIGGLKSIAELLNWEYKRSFKFRGRVIQAIIVNLDEFINFIMGG